MLMWLTVVESVHTKLIKTDFKISGALMCGLIDNFCYFCFLKVLMNLDTFQYNGIVFKLSLYANRIFTY